MYSPLPPVDTQARIPTCRLDAHKGHFVLSQCRTWQQCAAVHS